MWVTGSVMWAAASDESLKFGVQGATATDFRELTAHEITGFDCNTYTHCVAISHTQLTLEENLFFSTT